VHVQSNASGVANGLEEMLNHLGLERANALVRDVAVKGEVGSAAEVQHRADESFVERGGEVAEAIDAFAGAKRLRYGLAESEGDIFGGVVAVNFRVAIGVNGEVDEGMRCELVEHVVEEGQPGDIVRIARAVKRQRHHHAHLRSLAVHLR